MPKRKKNFNFIFFIIIIAVIIGGGFWFYQQWPKNGTKEDLDANDQLVTQEPEKFEITEELARQMVVQVIPNKYSKDTAEFFIGDLNGDALAEVIVTALPEIQQEEEGAAEAYLAVVTPTDTKGHYTKIADFFFGKAHYLLFRSTPRVLDYPIDIIDIDLDGKKEIVLDLGSGGASNEAFGIFRLDWDSGKIIWLQVQRVGGEIENSYFLKGGSIMHQETFELGDIDKDGKVEIVEKEGVYIGTGSEPDDWQKDENWQWETYTYKWNGNIFIYSK